MGVAMAMVMMMMMVVMPWGYLASSIIDRLRRDGGLRHGWSLNLNHMVQK